jgi:hypothetical protein
VETLNDPFRGIRINGVRRLCHHSAWTVMELPSPSEYCWTAK